MRKIPKDQHRMILTRIFAKSLQIDVSILMNDGSRVNGKVKNVKDSTLEIANEDVIHVFEILMNNGTIKSPRVFIYIENRNVVKIDGVSFEII